MAVAWTRHLARSTLGELEAVLKQVHGASHGSASSAARRIHTAVLVASRAMAAGRRGVDNHVS